MKILENQYKNEMPYGAAFAAPIKAQHIYAGTSPPGIKFSANTYIFCQFGHLMQVLFV